MLFFLSIKVFASSFTYLFTAKGSKAENLFGASKILKSYWPSINEGLLDVFLLSRVCKNCAKPELSIFCLCCLLAVQTGASIFAPFFWVFLTHSLLTPSENPALWIRLHCCG